MVSWITLQNMSWVCPGLIAPSGTVRLMLDSGRTILPPELVTEDHLVKRVSVRREELCCLCWGLEDPTWPGLLSNVPAERGLMLPGQYIINVGTRHWHSNLQHTLISLKLPPVELLEVSDMSGLTMESTGLLLGRITIGCS